MNTKTVQTYAANIYVGLHVNSTGYKQTTMDVADICQQYVNSVGYCVTVTPTTFLYKGGRENGCVVGLINYPRFPSTKAQVRKHAMTLAGILLKTMEQQRMSIVYPDRTVMLTNDEVPQVT
jgi:hypothetical protein